MWCTVSATKKWRKYNEKKIYKSDGYGGSGGHDDGIHGGSGFCDVSGAIESTWNAAQGQVKDIVNNVVFPVIDMILAILFFVKIATAYMDYRKHGQFEFTAPAILFACLLFSLTAPSYIWSIL